MAILPWFLTADDVANGQLLELPTAAKPPSMLIHMLHPFTRDLPQRAKEFMDFSIAYWREIGLVDE